MEDNGLAEDFPTVPALLLFPPAADDGSPSSSFDRSVPQVAYSWNSNLINQVRGNLMRGSRHMGSHK